MSKTFPAQHLADASNNFAVPNSISAQEVVDIARANASSGQLWAENGCTDFVWAVTNLAGARFFDPQDKTINGDPLYPQNTNYFVPHNTIWIAKNDPGHTHPGVDYRDDLWAPVSIPSNFGPTLEPSELVQLLMPGDVVRAYTNDKQEDGHSFIVTGRTIDQNGQIHISIIDNTDGIPGNVKDNHINEHDLYAFKFINDYLDDPKNVYIFRLENGFEGHTINYSRNFPTESSSAGTQDVTVGPGLELNKLSPTDVLSFGTVDISNDRIVFHFAPDSHDGVFFSDASFNGFTITDSHNEVNNIVGVNLLQNGGNVSLDASHISFDANHVSLNLAGLSFAYGSTIELGLHFL